MHWDAYTILVGEPEGKRLVERRRLRWKNNIKMDLGDRMGGWTGFIWLMLGTIGWLLSIR
jgi:hypothetical protein